MVTVRVGYAAPGAVAAGAKFDAKHVHTASAAQADIFKRVFNVAYDKVLRIISLLICRCVV